MSLRAVLATSCKTRAGNLHRRSWFYFSTYGIYNQVSWGNFVAVGYGAAPKVATGLNAVCEANGVREAAGAIAELRNSRPPRRSRGGTAQIILQFYQAVFTLY